MAWDRRLLTGTRGQILQLLRRGESTIRELAGQLELTDNAIRAHLATLARDGLAQQRGVRRGLRKPAHTYELTDVGRRLFPAGGGPVLDALLGVLVDRLPPAEVEAILHEAGRRAAASYAAPAADLPDRLERAADTLNELGGLAMIEHEGPITRIRASGCPLGDLVRQHPYLCRLVASLVSELAGLPARETCDRTGPPRCSFDLALSA